MINNIDFVQFPDLNLEPLIQTVSAQPEPTKKGSKTLLIVVLAVLAILIVGILVRIYSENRLETEVSEQN